MTINHDLESTPLKIKTNTDILNGDEESIRVFFYDSSESVAGHVIIDIRQTTYYKMKHCMTTWGTINWDTDTEIDKVWTITKESGPRIKIHCNGELITDLEMSETTCDDTTWSLIWDKDVSKMRFSKSDLASDFYFGPAAG